MSEKDLARASSDVAPAPWSILMHFIIRRDE